MKVVRTPCPDTLIFVLISIIRTRSPFPLGKGMYGCPSGVDVRSSEEVAPGKSPRSPGLLLGGESKSHRGELALGEDQTGGAVRVSHDPSRTCGEVAISGTWIKAAADGVGNFVQESSRSQGGDSFSIGFVHRDVRFGRFGESRSAVDRNANVSVLPVRDRQPRPSAGGVIP